MELQIPEEETKELVPYERGLSLREVVKGTLARFFPGSVIGMGVLSAIIPPAGLGGLRLLELLLVHELGPLVLGFGLGLLGLFRWLYPDSEVTGRRSFIAGLLTPIAMLGAGVLSSGFQVQLALVSFLVGIVMAVAMYFPWLSPTPEEKRSDRYGRGQPDKMTDGSQHST
jgi:hypothetical protein